jgi:hypothetical protein
LLLCAASLGQLFFDVLHQLSFVLGVVWYGTRAAQRQVAQRFSQKGQQAPGQRDEDGKAEARRLTSSIKKVHSAEKLIEVLDWAVDDPIFNFFHASAAYTQLERLKRNRDLQRKGWDGPVLLRLHTRVEHMMGEDQLDARALANVLWSLAQMSERFSIPTKLLIALVKSLPSKARGMKPQESSNCLWACAKLMDVAPVVLEMAPAIVEEIPNRAKDMKPLELSNCFWALAKPKDCAPDVLNAVPAIVAQIAKKAEDMVAQGLSNCLWASGQLKDVAPEVLQAVPAILTKIPNTAKHMKPQGLSNCLFACAQFMNQVPTMLEIVPAIAVEILAKINNMNGQDLSNSLEALVLLDAASKVAGFLAASGSMDDILRSAAKRLNTLLPRIRGKDFSYAVPVVVWACAQAEVYDGELFASVARRLGSHTKLSALPGFGVCALSWSYQVLDAQDDFEDFKTLLLSETEKRGFSEADVQSCQLGRSGWNRS